MTGQVPAKAGSEGPHIVRNKWYYGWGIRLVPHGWMFNVSGLDAVELDFDGGRKFRIGTDEPDRLLAAIRGNAPHLSEDGNYEQRPLGR